MDYRLKQPMFLSTTMKLTGAQRIILFLGSCLSFVTFLFPPWANADGIFQRHAYLWDAASIGMIHVGRLCIYQCLIAVGTFIALQLATAGNVFDE